MKILILLIVVSISSNVFSVEKIQISNLHPAQFTVGMIAVTEKIEKLEKKKQEGKVDSYLKKKAIKIILGPKNIKYIVDGHHLTRAVYESSLQPKEIYAEVIEDLSTLKKNEFITKMKDLGAMYLYKNGDGPLSFDLLPSHIKDLEDDPYRSFSWLVREEGGYENIDYHFLEFIWADFFRKHFELTTDSNQIKKYVEQGVKLARSKEASHLPGFIKEKQSESE